MSHFLELRQRVADCRTTLRALKDAYDLVKAEAEQNAFESGAAGGPNEPARQRSLVVALDGDPAFRAARGNLRMAEQNLDQAEALLEAACDERRASEWQIRARLADGLLGYGIQPNSDDPTSDGAFDDALLYSLDTQAALAAGR